MTVRSTSRLFDFPNPVNETSARLVAGGVVAMTALYLVTGWLAVLLAITYGFWARVLTGPTLSPLGRLVTGWLTPRVEVRWGPGRPVPGPPKRFAQGIGASLSTVALVSHLAGAEPLAVAAVAAITGAATLESVAGYCLGCTVFGWLMRIGLVPEAVCRECADVTSRLVDRVARPEAAHSTAGRR